MEQSSLVEPTFSGRRILISGGARGIGRAVAARIGALGGSVHIISRSQSALATAEELKREGVKASGYCGSVGDELFCRTTIETIEANDGPIDTLVNAAGVLGPHGPFAELNMSEFADAISTNVMGVCNLIRWTLPQMQTAKFGRIINFAGGGAAYAYPLFTPYATSKVAVVRLTETIAEEISVPNVTVNIIAPGAVQTDMLTEVRRRGGEVRTVTDISEPVKLVVYLASQAAAHISGRFIHVRDDYTNPDLFKNNQMLKLRRVEQR